MHAVIKSLFLKCVMVAQNNTEHAFLSLFHRYRSITKQFFRKADGVVLIYDITLYSSFRAVRPWLASIQEKVGDSTPIMLLGNKSDRESIREVPVKEAEILAKVGPY